MKEVVVGRGFVAIVDDEDFAELSLVRWNVLTQKTRNWTTHYARRTYWEVGSYHTVMMHRIIMKPDAGWMVDHINGNGLDNRRCNLRLCSRSQNIAHGRYIDNPTGFRGVYRQGGNFTAQIGINGKKRNLGTHATPDEAARAYDKAALEAFGEYARLNFPTSLTGQGA